MFTNENDVSKVNHLLITQSIPGAISKPTELVLSLDNLSSPKVNGNEACPKRKNFPPIPQYFLTNGWIINVEDSAVVAPLKFEVVSELTTPIPKPTVVVGATKYPTTGTIVFDFVSLVPLSVEENANWPAAHQVPCKPLFSSCAFALSPNNAILAYNNFFMLYLVLNYKTNLLAKNNKKTDINHSSVFLFVI